MNGYLKSTFPLYLSHYSHCVFVVQTVNYNSTSSSLLYSYGLAVGDNNTIMSCTNGYGQLNVNSLPIFDATITTLFVSVVAGYQVIALCVFFSRQHHYEKTSDERIVSVT